MEKAVFLFPGQGSQYVGMGKEFYENFDIIRTFFDEASDVAGLDLKKLCFEGPESSLTQTENAQPAVTLINIAILEILRSEGIFPSACAGHSLGEYSALYAANVIDFKGVMKLVKYRGTCMQEAAEKSLGGMTAIMGLGTDTIAKICEKVKGLGHAEIANINSPRQVIISGEKNALEKAAELAKKEGAKLIIPLKVSGPWHSKFMLEARQAMEGVLKTLSFREAHIPIIANATADYEFDPELIKKNLIIQMTNPVLWAISMERFIADGYGIFVEVGPKKALSGLMRDTNRDVKIFGIENMRTLDRFLNATNQKDK